MQSKSTSPTQIKRPLQNSETQTLSLEAATPNDSLILEHEK